MHNYGEALQYQREIAGLSLIELERKVGISNQNLGRWERGEVIPNVDFCVRLAAFYGISVNELLGISEGGTVPTIAPSGERYSAEERQLIEDFRQLNSYKKELVKNTITAMLPQSTESTQKKRNRNG